MANRDAIERLRRSCRKPWWKDLHLSEAHASLAILNAIRRKGDRSISSLIESLEDLSNAVPRDVWPTPPNTAITRSAFYDWKNGKRPVRGWVIALLAATLGCEIEDICPLLPNDQISLSTGGEQESYGLSHTSQVATTQDASAYISALSQAMPDPGDEIIFSHRPVTRLLIPGVLQNAMPPGDGYECIQEKSKDMWEVRCKQRKAPLENIILKSSFDRFLNEISQRQALHQLSELNNCISRGWLRLFIVHDNDLPHLSKRLLTYGVMGSNFALMRASNTPKRIEWSWSAEHNDEARRKLHQARRRAQAWSDKLADAYEKAVCARPSVAALD